MLPRSTCVEERSSQTEMNKTTQQLPPKLEGSARVRVHDGLRAICCIPAYCLQYYPTIRRVARSVGHLVPFLPYAATSPGSSGVLRLSALVSSGGTVSDASPKPPAAAPSPSLVWPAALSPSPPMTRPSPVVTSSSADASEWSLSRWLAAAAAAAVQRSSSASATARWTSVCRRLFVFQTNHIKARANARQELKFRNDVCMYTMNIARAGRTQRRTHSSKFLSNLLKNVGESMRAELRIART